jgi:hypothetical protein
MLMYKPNEETLPDFLRKLSQAIDGPTGDFFHTSSVTMALGMAAKIIEHEPPLVKSMQSDDSHPLDLVFGLAIQQLTKGKGVRHGGDTTPFMDQRWLQLSKNYGSAGLFFQADKKLQEAQQKTGEDRRRELLGALNYLAMGILFEEQKNG